MVPDENGNVGYFGIGNFFNANIQPDESLDVLNGGAKIRELPSGAYMDDGLEKMVVVDDDGLLHWRPVLDPADDCEWTMNTGANNNVFTAVGLALDPDCPDDLDLVGIGVDPDNSNDIDQAHKAKLNVLNRAYSTTIGNDQRTGVHVKVEGGSTRVRGVQVFTEGGTFADFAGDFISHGNASYTVGVSGYTTRGALEASGVLGLSHSQANENHGVHGKAPGRTGFLNGTFHPGSTTPGTIHYGVRGYASSQLEGQVAYGVHGDAPTDIADSWAVYSNGRQFSTTSPFWASDEQLKTNIENLEGSLTKVLALEPKSYEFAPEAAPQLNLEGGTQYGLIAHELEDVFPNMVMDVRIPAVIDSTGAVTTPSLSIKAVHYGLLIPVLISAIKEQQVQITADHEQLAAQQAEIAALAEQAAANVNAADEMQELRDRLDQLEQLLALCCQNPALPDTDDQRNLLDEGNSFTNPADERILRIQPNPFNEQTTIYYNLERGGRMQLMVNSSDGKQLRVLEDAQMPAGEYQYA